jgi:ABC-type hemin transport system substrate-binding protein
MYSLLHPNRKNAIHAKIGAGAVPILLNTVHKDPIVRGGDMLHSGDHLGTTNRIVGFSTHSVNPKTANKVSNTLYQNQPVRLGSDLVEKVKNIKPIPKEELKKKRNNIKMIF